MSSVEQRHFDVHQDNVGTELLGKGDRLNAIIRLANNLEIIVQLEQLTEPLAHYSVVIRNQNCRSSHINNIISTNSIMPLQRSSFAARGIAGGKSAGRLHSLIISVIAKTTTFRLQIHSTLAKKAHCSLILTVRTLIRAK
jgi:hypothetical protein